MTNGPSEVKPPKGRLAPSMNREFRPPSQGQVIARGENVFVIGRVLDKGGFGAVWECSDRWGNDLVAKVLLPNNLPYEAIRSAWSSEIEKLLRLRHPNITFLHDAFEHQDTFYLILERCSQSLKVLLNWSELRGEIWVLPIARCVLQALDFIHRTGIVHKDLHPGNVFTSLQRNELLPGEPGGITLKVGDLGISGPLSEIDWFNTRLAEWMLPPEVLLPREFGAPGHQVDVYHSGLMFLGLLNGREAAFTTEEVLAGIPRQQAEALGTPLGLAVSEGLRRHVQARPQSALAYWLRLAEAGKRQGLAVNVVSDIS